MIIKNAKAYIEGEFKEVDILIKEERIVEVAMTNKITAHDEEIIDAKELIVLPGLIEIHAHLREPGQTYKEDFLTGSKAALAGGYCCVYDMPNNLPNPTITKAALDEKKELAKKAQCEIRFHFGATNNNFDEVRAANPESLKMYLGKTTGNIILDDERSVLRHMEEFPKERQIIIHAQSEGMNEEENVNTIRKVILLAKTAGRKIHFTHLSTSRELKIAKEQKGTYQKITVDSAPHYLFLSKEDVVKMKCCETTLVNPELKSKNEVASMWKHLEMIDAIGTDHAPHLQEEKQKGARGIPGLETALALFLDAHSKNLISLEWIAQRFSENPAKIMGLEKYGYGKINVGFFANLTLVDLKKEWIIKGSELNSKAKWTPFEGKNVMGKVVKTIYKGKIAYDDSN